MIHTFSAEAAASALAGDATLAELSPTNCEPLLSKLSAVNLRLNKDNVHSHWQAVFIVRLIKMDATDSRETRIGADVRSFVETGFACFFQVEEHMAAKDAKESGVTRSTQQKLFCGNCCCVGVGQYREN